MLYYLVYVSSATTLLPRAELEDILQTSRRNNASLDVSGALLYQDGNLMQVLEGEESVVRALYARIGLDRRHQGLLTLLDGYQDDRQFPDWSMAFRDVGRDQVDHSDGFSTFLNTPLTAAEFGADPSLSQRLLLSFKQSLSLP